MFLKQGQEKSPRPEVIPYFYERKQVARYNRGKAGTGASMSLEKGSRYWKELRLGKTSSPCKKFTKKYF